jgi:hypothetical protein
VRALFPDATSGNLISSLSLTVPQGVLLGTVNSEPFKVWFVLLKDGSTLKVGAMQSRTSVENMITGFPSNGIIPVVMFGSAAGQIYAGVTPPVVPCPFVILGFAEYDSGLATAGNWSAAPTRIIMYGPGIKLPGSEIQIVANATGAFAQGTTVTPSDNTIPQITEGDQYMSQAITPKSTSSVLEIEAQAALFPSDTFLITAALFKVGQSNALVASLHGNGAQSQPLSTRHFTGSISAVTFTYRAGKVIGATTYFNGNGAALYGGTMNSYIKVVERAT